MNYCEIVLEEENIFPTEGGALALMFDGTVTIGYRSILDWWVSDVDVACTNGKSGALCRSWEVSLPKDHPIFVAVERFLVNDDGRVAEAIMADEFAQHESRLFDEGKERAKGMV